MIKEINICSIPHLTEEARQSGLSFNKSTNIYFGYFIDDKIVGFCGIMFIKNKAILKNGYVVKEHRRKGIYSKLNQHRFKYLQSKKIHDVECNATKMSLKYFVKYSPSILKEYKSCTKIKIDLRLWEEQQ